MKVFGCIWALAVILVCCWSAEPQTVRPLLCTDGDTFIAAPDSVVYRLWGVDAPELDQPWGGVAKSALIALIHKKQVKIVRHGASYNRPVVQVTTTNNRDVGLELLKMGLAWYCPEYAPDRDDYREAEAEARKAKRGLWSDRNPVNPADHRKKRNLPED